MLYSDQFEKFDPLSGDVPAHPFASLPDIARRARSMLTWKTKEQIVLAARRIDSELEQYFSDLKTQAVDELQVKLRDDQEEFLRFFEWDGKNSWSGRWSYKDEMDEELEIPTAMNSSEVDALKTIIDDRDSCFFLPKGAPEPEIDHWPEGKTLELFAVLSLWLLADSIDWAKSGGTVGPLISGEQAIKAMDAVCHAEHVREVEWLEQFHKKSLTEISRNADVRNQEISESVRQKLAAELAAHEQSKRTARSADLNAVRHAVGNSAKAMVVAEWGKNPNQFLSGEKAGIFYADWLKEKGVGYFLKGEPMSYVPRTVTDWIRAYAKMKGIKFR
jgi:hypothetical protein